MKEEEYNRLLERARNLCSRTERCSRDICVKLESWGMNNSSDLERAMKSLREEKFIDDARFAGYYVADKLKFNKWGKVKIRAMLRRKGIDEAIIEDCINRIEPVDYSALIREELSRKRKSIKARNRYDLKGKLFRFAVSRGYDPDQVYTIIDDILKDPDNPAR